jgi:hypothetical protein
MISKPMKGIDGGVFCSVAIVARPSAPRFARVRIASPSQAGQSSPLGLQPNVEDDRWSWCMRFMFVVTVLLVATSAYGRGDEWSQFGAGQHIEVDQGCTGTFTPGTIVKTADEPSQATPSRKRYTVKLDSGNEWSFTAPNLVAPCVRAPGGSVREYAALGPLPLQPGVYECVDQSNVRNPMMFGLINGATYMSSGGKRGRYSYETRTGILSLDPGAMPARYQRTSVTIFRPLLANGTLGGFTCSLNPVKNPQRPPW